MRPILFPFFVPVLLPILLSACAAVPPPAAQVVPVASGQTESADAGRQGIVSAADPRAVAAGVEMLRAGGSATDAAIATMLALTVVEPQSSGIGGGGFLVHGSPQGVVETFDGRETAPAAADGNWFMAEGKPMGMRSARPGGKSVGVPGNLRMVAKAHAAHGTLAWASLFEPAIRLARDGFAITPRFHEALTRTGDYASRDPHSATLYFGSDGEPLPVGSVVRNPALAKTFEALAARGADSFYVGPNAQALAARVQGAAHNPAPLTTGDLATYDAKLRDPVCGTYRAHRICSMGPPSSGATTVLAILGLLERFDMAALGKDSPTAWHLFAEAQRLAYADREIFAGDADYVPVPVSGMIDKAYLATRSTLISPTATMAQAPAGNPPGGPIMQQSAGLHMPEQGTSHFVAIDAGGNAVSYTSTIEGAFGSGLMVGGYFLNNELTDFSFVPRIDGKPVANRVEGGKRPRSSMSPTLVYAPDGSLRLAVGAAGGSTIIVQVARAIVGVIDFGLPAQQAIALPLVYSPDDTVFIEEGTALEAMIPALTALGHAEIRTADLPLKANAVERVGNRWVGAADPRSEGAAQAQ